MNDRLKKDIELLELVLDREDLSDSAKEAFEDMADKLGSREVPITDKQRAWAEAASRGEKYTPQPEYENAWSSGKVPRGREVPTPVALLPENLPKKPPGR